MNDAFDQQGLLEELDGDLEFLAESVEILDEDSAKLLKELRQASHDQDAETVAKTAHTLKSMVGNFVAGPAFEAALAVEKAAKEGDLAPAAIEELESQVRRLQDALHEFLRSVE